MRSNKPFLELRPVEAPAAATPGATVYVLLPTLEQLVSRPGFGLSSPIALPASLWPLDTRKLFDPGRPAFEILH
jgi:hypothetical protein